MLIYPLIGLAVLTLLLLVVVWLQPTDFRIQRSTIVAVPDRAVFIHVNDLRSWEAWSPWAKLDSAVVDTYEGPAAGVGASHHWHGNNKVGEGRMTITDSQPHRRIQLRLDFVRPFKCCNDVEFTFEPSGSQTLVTWVMTGKNNFMGKAFGLLMNMDKMVGKDFEKGLASLKQVAESPA